MAQSKLKVYQEAIKEQENKLAEAKDLIDRLKKAGESTLDLETKYNAASQRLQRFKDAFKD